MEQWQGAPVVGEQPPSDGGGSQEYLLEQVNLQVRRSDAALADLKIARAERDSLREALAEEQCVARSVKQALLEELRLSDEQLTNAALATSDEQRGAATLTRLLIACQTRLAELENVFGTLSSHSSSPAVVLNHVASLKLHSLPGAGREERAHRLAAVEARLELQHPALGTLPLGAHSPPTPLRRPVGPSSPSSARASSRGVLTITSVDKRGKQPPNSSGGGGSETLRRRYESCCGPMATPSRAAVAGVSSAAMLNLRRVAPLATPLASAHPALRLPVVQLLLRAFPQPLAPAPPRPCGLFCPHLSLAPTAAPLPQGCELLGAFSGALAIDACLLLAGARRRHRRSLESTVGKRCVCARAR